MADASGFEKVAPLSLRMNFVEIIYFMASASTYPHGIARQDPEHAALAKAGSDNFR